MNLLMALSKLVKLDLILKFCLNGGKNGNKK